METSSILLSRWRIYKLYTPVRKEYSTYFHMPRSILPLIQHRCGKHRCRHTIYSFFCRVYCILLSQWSAYTLYCRRCKKKKEYKYAAWRTRTGGPSLMGYIIGPWSRICFWTHKEKLGAGWFVTEKRKKKGCISLPLRATNLLSHRLVFSSILF